MPIVAMPPLSNLTGLVQLVVNGCNSLTSIPSLNASQNVDYYYLNSLSSLTTIAAP